jgi:hypothetical protein
MTNLHRSPPMNQSETDLGIVNESQLLGFGIRERHSDRYIVQGGRLDRHRAHPQPCCGWDVLYVLRLPQATRSAIVRWSKS